MSKLTITFSIRMDCPADYDFNMPLDGQEEEILQSALEMLTIKDGEISID